MARKTRKRNVRKKVQRGGVKYMIIHDESMSYTDIYKIISRFYVNLMGFTFLPFEQDYQKNINKIKELSLQYSEIIPKLNYGTVKPGDILYYPPDINKYSLGHIETILGREGEDDTHAYIIKSHPVKNPDGTAGIYEVHMLINDTIKDDSVVSFRYIGPNANLINATSALISKIFITKQGTEYGGFCSIIFKHCEETEVSAERTARLHRAFTKLFEGKEAHTVCSGFSILMCQLAFYIHDMEDILNIAMPFSAKQCSPVKLYNLLLKLPTFWQHNPSPMIKGNAGESPRNTIDYLFSIEKNI